LRSQFLYNILSDERMDPKFTTAAGPRQRIHSQVRFPRDLWSYFTVSYSRLPQPGGPGPRIYIPQDEGVAAIPPGTGFPFRRLLQLAGLRWRYSTPPLRVCWLLIYPVSTVAPVVFKISPGHWPHRKQPLYCWGMFTQLFHSNWCTRRISFRHISTVVAWGHYLPTAVFLAPQFLLWANTPQYFLSKVVVIRLKTTQK
jgi:hypothetical protein